MLCLSNITTLSNSAAIQPFQTSLNKCSPTYRYYSKKVVTQCKNTKQTGGFTGFTSQATYSGACFGRNAVHFICCMIGPHIDTL